MKRVVAFCLCLVALSAFSQPEQDKKRSIAPPNNQKTKPPGVNKVSTPGSAVVKPKSTNMNNLINKQVADKFAAFEKSRNPDFVLEALEILKKDAYDEAGSAPASPDQELTGWLLFFKLLDQHIDPAWNPEQLPVKGAPIPSSHKGVVFPSGEVNPSDITDPAERVQYEKALKATKDYSTHYQLQYHIKRIDENAMDELERLLTLKYANLPERKELFEALLIARREMIKGKND